MPARSSSFRNPALGAQRRKPENADARKAIDLERQMSRTWRPGDVYSPKDLSPFEQLKARAARMTTGRYNQLPRARSRRHGGADKLDLLRLNPLNEYKNFSMMAEFVSEMGRIKGAKETGLRAVNQRKLAKSVRRSIGMGIVPSVHRHPELMAERGEHRTKVWTPREHLHS